MSNGAKKIEITQSTLLKLLIRRGSNDERNNITLSEGELGYTVDTQRLFVGDGATVGGIPISFELYYGSTAPTAYTQAVNGDIAYDSTEGALYVLNGSDPTNFADWSPFLGASTARVDDQTIEKASFNGIPNTLMVKTVSAAQLDPQLPGLGLEFSGKTLQTKGEQTFDSINVRAAPALQLPNKLQFGTSGGATQYTLPSFDGPAGYSLVTNGQSVIQWAPGGAITQLMVLSGNQVPVGTILQYGSGGNFAQTISSFNVPYGYFKCDGRTLPASSYSALYGVISSYYGVDGADTFKIPSLSSTDLVYLIKYLPDVYIERMNVNLTTGLTGLNASTSATVSTFTYPVDELTTINIGVDDYVSKTYVDELYGSIRSNNTIWKLSDLCEPNGPSTAGSMGYITFIDARNKQLRYNGDNSGSSTGFSDIHARHFSTPTIPIEFDDQYEVPARIYSAERTSFVVSNSGILYAAGESERGTTGTGSSGTVPYFTKVNIPADAGKVIKVSIGGGYWGGGAAARHVFALTESGSAYGWGYNAFGQLAQGTTTEVLTPVSMHTGVMSAKRFKDIYSFSGYVYNYSFAIDIDNNVYSCGYNGNGALGIGNTTNTNSNWIQLTAWTADSIYGAAGGGGNQAQTTFLLSGGKVWGAGYNATGNLGVNNLNSVYTSFTPVCADDISDTQLTGVSSLHISDTSNNNNFTLAHMIDGSIKVWGMNTTGQLGIGNFGITQVYAPTASFAGSFVNANIVKAKVHGFYNGGITAVLNTAGEIWISGYGAYGMLGNGTTSNTSIFTRVKQPYGIKYKDFQIFGDIFGGYYYSIAAITTQDDIYVWGGNLSGQLGINRYSVGAADFNYSAYPIKLNFH